MLRTLCIALPLALLPLSVSAEPVATVGNKTITREEVEKEVKPELDELDAKRFEIIRGGIDQLVAQTLIDQEAAATGKTIEQLQQAEIVGKIAQPTDAEIQKVYDDNKAQMGGQTLDQVKDRIVQYLMQQKSAERAQAYIAELKKKYPTKILMRPKTVEVGLGSRPPLGKANAPITIIEFSDYECPFCKRAEPTVKEVLKAYGDKVRLAYRDYPLPFHKNARPASEAAHCAADQNKFWEYHDKVMAATDLSVTNLKTIAKDTGLDEKKFDECIASERFEAQINEDVSAGEKAGVQGTPAFFINGRMLDGAQPFEKFKEVIDEELEYSASKS